ncbi:MAG: hypothetical protein JWN72_1812, partial [Thermoleophilia bacterium]|nr:hypothetical protein [Thermoleophilia bacterium]
MTVDEPHQPCPLTRRRRRWAGVAWAAAVVATIGTQFLAQARWDGPEPYSLARFNISDLGNVTCRSVGSPSRDVCSPWHLATNVGFVAFGVLTIAGIVLLTPLWRRSWSGGAAAVLLALSGIGSALVGLAPSD